MSARATLGRLRMALGLVELEERRAGASWHDAGRAAAEAALVELEADGTDDERVARAVTTLLAPIR